MRGSGWDIDRHGLIPVLIVACSAFVACGGPSERAIESAVLDVVLDDWWCEHDPIVYIHDSFIDTRATAEALDFVNEHVDPPLPPSVGESFATQNDRPLLVSERTGCEIRSGRELATHQDTASNFADPPVPYAEPGAGIVRLSRVGADRSGSVALLSVSWTGGTGLCWSEYVVLRRMEDGWAVTDRVNFIVC